MTEYPADSRWRSYPPSDSIATIFKAGMKRDLPAVVSPDWDKPVYNLGAGLTQMPQAYNLDLPDWDGTRDRIPCGDGEAGGIYAFHFLEHLDNEQAIAMLRECQRALSVGCPLTIVVPHHFGTMAYHDLTHKTFYNADTFRNLMDNRWQSHEREGWRFRIGLNVTMGVADRNLALLTQLIKTGPTFSNDPAKDA